MHSRATNIKNNGRFLKFPGLYDNRYFTILFLIICPGAPIGSDRYALTFLFESFFEEEGMGTLNNVQGTGLSPK